MPARPQSDPLVLLRGLLANPLSARVVVRMPGESHRGPLPALTPEEQACAARLRATVEHLAGNIGDRNVFRQEAYAEAERWLSSRLASLGVQVQRQAYRVQGVECANLWIDIPPKHPGPHAGEIVLVASHYDSVRGCPAANDNGTGVACVLELAERFARGDIAHDRTMRLALFANEEPPHFWTDDMGSLVMARECRRRGDNIVAMLTPETIGCYFDEPGSQKYPLPLGGLYPTVGNFIAFIGITDGGDLLGPDAGGPSASLVKRCVRVFRETTRFPCEGAALPNLVPGVGSSDHWSFWRCGYPSLMITDTAPFRYPHYHTPDDTPDKVDFDRTARVVEGLGRVVGALAMTGR
jgi:hypothetical protein